MATDLTTWLDLTFTPIVTSRVDVGQRQPSEVCVAYLSQVVYQEGGGITAWRPPTFQAIAQDPTCTTAPCGLFVDIVTAFMPRATDATKCVYASDSGTFFATSKVGDNIDVTGSVDAYVPTGTSVTQHSIITDSIVKSSATAKMTPLDVTIQTSGDVQFANCYTTMTKPHDTAAMCPTGAAWQKYEGTYVKLAPASGVFTIGTVSTYNFTADFH